MEKQRLHAYVSGRVQGIGFRWHVIQAVRLHMPGIVGWVRNRMDGRVEVLAEGTHDELDRLLDVLNTGPSSARVTLVETEWAGAKGDLKGFDVNYTA